ncbi:alpha/beta hydrolase [Solirubrobacter ginsenosidimutans]|uniref:Alpha/beta hydrolase n=2 Tax=Solirubrobacter ginsenosidimutans TaxID=490573 RepID=A0A9X3MWD8_9ACTN|nr:alpha/beta fold hydrolase [Solirubrobacter ginsenosidimutans]MDA0162558.1 alpha/beta hydrolase [Solirubrobacter ginsenosidimutans]
MSYSLPGLVMTDHELQVPLDHANPDGEQIKVFAREIAEPDGRDKPFLVFFQGGPGFEAFRPVGNPRGPGYLDRALQEFRVLALDQRGTGRSTPVDGTESADYLKHFRADSIVRDAELLREQLSVKRWSILGQSFGGFCAFAYLSLAPDSLREALVTGGTPPIGRPVDDVYSATWARMAERNRRYYARFPQDRARMLDIVARLDADVVRLPGLDRLTSRRFRTHGNKLGMSDGAEALHYILELPFGSPAFLHDASDELGIARNPIYAILHEACYADGTVTNWSAARTRPAEFDEHPEWFTGEHILPWLFDDYGALSTAREVAHELAMVEWPRLYDEDVLRANTVPIAAAIYTEDPYVERRFSEETAALVPGMHAWVTSEYDHNGLRADGERILSRLIDLVRGRA